VNVAEILAAILAAVLGMLASLPGAIMGMAVGDSARNQLIAAVDVFMFTTIGGLLSLACAAVVFGIPLLLVRMAVRRRKKWSVL
jgi:hypothetical protein